MKKTIIIVIATILITVLLGIIFLFYENNFFVDFKSQTFNEVVTPFATIAAAIIYLYTLLEIRKQSKIANNNFQFNFFLEKIENERQKLKNWKFSLLPDNDLKEFSEIISQATGLKFYGLYSSIYLKIKNSKEYLHDLENGVAINQSDEKEYVKLINALIKLNVEISMNNFNIEMLLKEINKSNLSDFQKESLIELIIIGLLNDYILIFYEYFISIEHQLQVQNKWINCYDNEILYKQDIIHNDYIVDSDLKLCSTFKVGRFDRLSKYIFNNKLWKYKSFMRPEF